MHVSQAPSLSLLQGTATTRSSARSAGDMGLPKTPNHAILYKY